MVKKILIALLCLLLVACSTNSNSIDDGKDRPSNSGQLKVLDGKLVNQNNQQVVLRGLSNNGVSGSERFINQETFDELSTKFGCNVFRMALYTYGMGIVGYCTGGHQDKLKETIYQSAEYAKNSDMYLIVDWHVLSEGSPMKYLDDAKAFFKEVSEKLKDYNNVIYEICNEPNGVDWQTVKEYANIIIPIIRENAPNSLILVGEPDWSKDLASVSSDPLDYENIMYTYHFYSDSHRDEYRNSFEEAAISNLPIFVSEFGITASSGGFPRNIEEADKWIELLEKYNISYVMWNFSKSGEACATIKADCLKTSGFDLENELTQTGTWFVDTVKKYSK